MYVCEQLVQSRYLTVKQLGIEPPIFGKMPSLLPVTAENGDHSSPSVPVGTGGPKSK